MGNTVGETSRDSRVLHAVKGKRRKYRSTFDARTHLRPHIIKLLNIKGHNFYLKRLGRRRSVVLVSVAFAGRHGLSLSMCRVGLLLLWTGKAPLIG